MDMHSRKQYLKELQKEYLAVGKLGRIKLLNEAVKRTGLNRKYLIRRLSPKTSWDKFPRKRSSRLPYYGSNLVAPLVKLWDIFDHPCGQRLTMAIANELERLRNFGEINLTDQEALKLKTMCPKTIDSLLAHEKEARIMQTKYEKKKHPLLYQQVPTKLSDEWDRDTPGQIQIDAVEHCGQSAAGDFVNTVSVTDISSHWWEGEAIIGQGKARTVEALKIIRNRFPLKWSEIHPDNGTAFLNYFLYDYAKETNLKFSRSRAFRKNDNCFVEQKNSRNVRMMVGHVRYDSEQERTILNDLYRYELRLYRNFFCPVMRLQSKERDKGQIHRKYKQAKTPYQWLMENQGVSLKTKQILKERYDSLNPADLKRRIDVKLKLLANVYQAKQYSTAPKMPQTKRLKVTFLNYPTVYTKLPSYVT
jgi:hypothetical protein